MLLPLCGLVSCSIFFVVIGAVVLRLTGIRPLRPVVLLVFVVVALLGMSLFGGAYSALFADESHQLRSNAAIIGLLIGLPAAGTLTGWSVAYPLATLLTRARAGASGSARDP